MTKRAQKTFMVDLDVHERVMALGRRLGVPAAQLVREAEELVLERYERLEDAAEIHRQRAEDRDRLERARAAARAKAGKRPDQMPPAPRPKTVRDYYRAGEKPVTRRIG